MKPGFSIVPFKADKIDGISEIVGLAKFSAAGIVLEFEEEYMGLMKTGGIKEARMPLGDILDIQFKKGIWGFFAKIVIRFKNLGALEGLPTNKGRLILKIARADSITAVEIVENMQHTLSGKHQESPPPSVRHLFGDEADTKDLEENQ